jgi:hypothetical protein
VLAAARAGGTRCYVHSGAPSRPVRRIVRSKSLQAAEGQRWVCVRLLRRGSGRGGVSGPPDLFWKHGQTVRRGPRRQTRALTPLRPRSAPGASVFDMYGGEPRNSASSPRQDVERDASVLVSVAELDAERRRGHLQEELAAADENAARPASRCRPRPGHYPTGFSPYRMSNKHGGVQLDRRSVRNDFKVRPGLCRLPVAPCISSYAEAVIETSLSVESSLSRESLC